jgi:IS30 family transposase
MARRAPKATVDAFWMLIRSGLTPAEAGVAAGVSVDCGRRVFNHAGGVKPQVYEPHTSGVRPRLTLSERIKIEVGVHRGQSLNSIAAGLGRATSTIKRELDNNVRNRFDGRRSGYRRKQAFGARQSGNTAVVHYDALAAHESAHRRARRPKLRKLAVADTLRHQVQTRLQQHHSPTQIARRLRCEYPEQPEMWVSHEAIYQSLYVQGRGSLRRELHQCLRTKRAIRRPHHQPGSRRTRIRIRDMVNISERPAEVADRAVPGHWEGDLIMGSTASASAIGTLVERSTRFVMLLHLPDNHGALAVQNAIIAKMIELPEHLRRSLTWDQGIEMANHAAIAAATDLDIYFCDPHSPWQRGTNENTNGLLRQYFPKGTDLSLWGPGYLDQVAAELNARPRQTLHWRTPAEALNELLLENPPVASIP